MFDFKALSLVIIVLVTLKGAECQILKRNGELTNSKYLAIRYEK